MSKTKSNHKEIIQKLSDLTKEEEVELSELDEQQKKEGILYKEEIRVDGFGTIVNDIGKLGLLDVVEFRIKNILANDLRLIHVNLNTLSELIKLREQLRS